MIKDALYAVTHGQDLSYDLAKDTMNKIMSGDVAEVPMAGFLCALAAKGPTVDEVTAFAEVMREKAGSVPHVGTVGGNRRYWRRRSEYVRIFLLHLVLSFPLQVFL